MVRLRTLTPLIEVRILVGHPATLHVISALYGLYGDPETAISVLRRIPVGFRSFPRVCNCFRQFPATQMRHEGADLAQDEFGDLADEHIRRGVRRKLTAQKRDLTCRIVLEPE